MTITLYLVGTDAEDAAEGLIFDSIESAESYQQDNPGLTIYEASATIHTDTMSVY